MRLLSFQSVVTTAADSVAYAVGAKDELRGTGVWSFVKADRNGSSGNKGTASKPKPAKKNSPTRFPGGKK
ncbi:hypothetical protein BE221DRAFT_74790 [Ostreococcus tauri]|uniref:Uncharacterized protein n=1 Tax=Ostreococcus tauri TaxID=70448 RepID=A0A1Y5IDT6_OSTTA|nr:hypothetical protein BE221DRAFT_74790 [Ostreococcus tauri]